MKIKFDITKLEVQILRKALSSYCEKLASKKEKERLEDLIGLMDFEINEQIDKEQSKS